MGFRNVNFNKTEKLVLFVTPRGFEPPTFGSGNRHSIQLNYGAVQLQKYQINAKVCHLCIFNCNLLIGFVLLCSQLNFKSLIF